jgi:DNA polymerase III delta prime subunit
MHAYLIVGREEERIGEQIEKLVRKLKVKILEFPLEKINDVRDLNSFTKLEISQKTAILIKGIDAATTPALNAFLKSLEEPQENLVYILTCANKHSLLPTIVSRCQVIKTVPGSQPLVSGKLTNNFLEKSISEKLLFTSEIRKRDEAVNFVEKFILGGHLLLINKKRNHLKISKSIRSANTALANLKANGNVQLQLTSFVLSLV